MGNHHVDRRALTPQTIFKPTAQRRFRRVKPPQSLGDLTSHDFRQFACFIVGQGKVHRNARTAAGAKHTVDKQIAF